MNKKSITMTLALAVAMLAAATVVPVASAQQPSLEVAATGPKLIRPEIDFKTMNIDIIYSFPNPGFSTGTAVASNVVVNVVPECPNYVTVSGATVKLVPITAGNAQATADVDWDIGMTRQAPGLQSIGCNIKYSADAYAPTVAPEVAEKKFPFTVSAGYYGAMAVKLSQPLQKAGPQKEVNFDLELTNFGNAKTSVLFTLGSEPNGKRWEQLLPTTLIVDTLTTGGNNKDTAIFQVSTPYKTGWNNELGSYQLVMSTSAFDDPNQQGNTMTADVLVRVRGVFVPGFEAVALVGGLLGSVVIFRNREEE